MMRVLRLTTISLLLGAAVMAQQPQTTRPASQPTSQPASQPTSQPASQPGSVPENAPVELTPQERLAALKKTLDKLRKEQAVLERVLRDGGLGRLVKQRIKRRNIRGELSIQMGPVMPKPKHARLMMSRTSYEPHLRAWRTSSRSRGMA